MNAPQFTPGPLKAVGREVWVIRDGIEAGMLCRSAPETPTGSTYEQSPDEVIANARLIAAAPELYVALARFVAYLDKGEGSLSHELEYAMRDALAEVHGEQVPA